MNIIIDSNVLFSALIRDSTTRRMIFEYKGLFLFPMFIFEELENHKAELSQKSGLTEADFERLLELLLEKVSIVPNEVLYPCRKEAFEIVKEIDPDDVIFIACALAYPGSILWSDDKRLKRVKRINVLNTKEIMEFV
ncbi:MAG: PIN domain-containing protein [Nanoarchaeota archaeon]|nr:PIN domain-containing protein [Nanoarchaeota archaeon]